MSKQPETIEVPDPSAVSTDSKSPSSVPVGSNFLAITIVVCTLLIIAASVTIANKTVRDIREIMNESEYTKAGGEENFKLLREIQKDQMTNYIHDLSAKDPAYVEGLKRKIKRLESGQKAPSLTQEEIAVLRDETYIRGNTGALITLVEFSNFACPFCQDFHRAGVIRDIVESDSEGVNSIFKHIPSRDHPEADIYARGGKCVLSLSGGLAYADFIDRTFSGALRGSGSLASPVGIDKTKFTSCLPSTGTTASLEHEMGQGIFLGIKSTPSVMILNNRTGEYTILEGKSDKKSILEGIETVK